MKVISGTVVSSQLFYKAVSEEEQAEHAPPRELNISESSGRRHFSELLPCHGAATECRNLLFWSMS